MPPRRERAAPVARPGAQRLTLRGFVAMPDDFGNCRFILADRVGGCDDYSSAVLRREVQAPNVSYELYVHPTETDLACAGETPGVVVDRRAGPDFRGVFWAKPPAHRRAYWLARVAELRTRPALVEVLVRGYFFGATLEDDPRAGKSFDLVDIKPL